LSLRQWTLFAEVADARLRREAVERLNLTAAAFGADAEGLDDLRRQILADDYAAVVEDHLHIATPTELQRVGIKGRVIG
jgi:hypothetical protein